MAGEEILIADGPTGDREGLVALARKLGLMPGVVDNAAVGRERVSAKFYAAALIDLDLVGGGLDLLSFIHQRSPATQLILLCSRKSFDAAVVALRMNCVDVIKRPEESGRLQQAIEGAITRYQSDAGMGMRDVLDVLDEFTRTIINLGREVYAGEIREFTEGASTLSVLFVEEDQRLLKEISENVGVLPIEAYVELSGGGALDKCSIHNFDILVSRHSLMDLPGQIVLSAAQARNPECVGLLYTAPGPGGRIERVIEGRVADTYTPFTNARHIAERVRLVVEEELTRRRERKVLQVISARHADLLRRYAEAKRKLEAV